MAYHFIESSYNESHPTGSVISYSCRMAVFNPLPEDIALTKDIEHFATSQGLLGGGQERFPRGSLAHQRRPRATAQYTVPTYNDNHTQLRRDDHLDHYSSDYVLSALHSRDPPGPFIHEPRYPGQYAGYAPSDAATLASSSLHPRQKTKAIEYFPNEDVARSMARPRRKKSSKHAPVLADKLRYVDEFDDVERERWRHEQHRQPRSSSHYPATVEQSPPRGRSRTRWCDKLAQEDDRREGRAIGRILEDEEEDYGARGGWRQQQQQQRHCQGDYRSIDITPYHLAPPRGAGEQIAQYDSDW